MPAAGLRLWPLPAFLPGHPREQGLLVFWLSDPMAPWALHGQRGRMGPVTPAVCQQDSALDTALTETNNIGQGFKDPDMNFLRREISDAFHWLLIINALLSAQLCCCWLGTLCCCPTAASRHWQLWMVRLQCQHCCQGQHSAAGAEGMAMGTTG